MEKGTYPLTIDLPGGIRAELVASNPPRYAVNGEMTEIDVTVSDDLSSWFWWGSFLTWKPHPEQVGISIDTGTFPPPGWPSNRPDCFTQARAVEAARVKYAAAAKPAKPPKKAKKKAAAPAPEPEPELVAEQLALFDAPAAR